MRRVGFAALLGGAAALGAVSVHAAPLFTLSLNLPTPIVAPDQVMSPSALAVRLGKQGFRVDEMYRKGLAYAVTADGPSGNKVLLMVDGRSGVILGLNVLAAKVAVVPQRAPNAVYTDDRHPFGAVVPGVVYVSWQRYDQPQWAQPGPATVPAPKASMAPFRYAVPTQMVHASPKTGKSFAVAPPHFKGMQLRNQNGQPIKNSGSKSDAADAEAAYQAERANQAEYDKTLAQEDAVEQREEADDANGRADEANGRADEANGRADEAEQDRDAFAQAADDAEARATAAEDKNIELQRQMEANGTADQDCSSSDSGCDVAEGDIATHDDSADELADGKPAAEDEQAGPPSEPTAEEAQPADHTSAEGQPAEEAAPASEPTAEEAAPGARTDTAEDRAPANEEAAPASEPAAEEAQPQEETAPAAEEAAPPAADPPEEAAPEPQAQPDEAPQAEEPQQQEEQPQAEEPQQDDSSDMGGGGGGGDDSGGGGDDGGGGGGGDDDPN